MKNSKSALLIGTIMIILAITFLLSNNSSSKGETFEEDGFFEQVNNKLKEEDYAFLMLSEVYSKDDIWVKIILANKEATELVQKEVQSIFYESVENNNLNSNSFTLKIVDSNDGSDW